MRDMLLVLNFDDISSRAVTRKLRSERILCKIVPGDISLEEIQAQDPSGILLAGSTAGEAPLGLDGRIMQSGLPILALGDAAALLLSVLEGTPGEKTIEGAVAPLQYARVPLLEDLEDGERYISCARDFTLPELVDPICRSGDIIIGFAHESLPLFGLQFEVEQNDPEGSLLLRNFALSICHCTTWWDDDAFVARAVEEIDRVVGDGTAVCAMTGGVDSGVSALLAYKALGSRLKCIFVDTGLLRAQEGDNFIAFYRDTIGMDITRVYAQDRFLSVLRGIEDPQEKRRIIGETIQQILQEEKEKLGVFDAAISGTSFHDIMFNQQSGPRPALSNSIPVIEPVRELFKDEIRRIGDYLGIPAALIAQPPFPGSGLALRILGEVTLERLQTLRAVDAIFCDALQQAGLTKRLWQYFAVLCPMPGDEQGAVICLRSVQSASDSGQAYAARLPYDVVEAVVEKAMEQRPEVRRVVYDLTPSRSYTGVEWQ